MRESLRGEAEAVVRGQGTSQPAEFETPEAARLALHELRVHQVELEMQNEELRRAQAELDLVRSRYFELYDLAPIGYFTLSVAGLIIQANLTAVTMLGATRVRLLGRLFERRVHAEDRGAYHSFLQRLLETGERQSMELRVERDDQSLFWAQLTMTTGLNEAGAPERRVVMSDVTARIEADRTRREGEARYRDLFSRASDGIVLCTLRGRVVECNAAFAQMHGMTQEEFGRHNLRELERVPALTPARLSRMAGGEVLTLEVEHRHRDGHSFALEASISQVAVAGVQHVLGLYREITARRQLQAGLAQNDRLASMGMVAAGVAHEINNPLVYLLSNVERLAAELPSAVKRLQAGDSEAVPLLEELMESSRCALEGALRIKKISRALGSFSRVERDTVERIDVNHALESAATMAHNELKFRGRLVKKLGEVPPVLASEGKLTQVFLNLLINAAHAILEGHVEQNSVILRTWAEGGQVFAEITDTGRGIAPENLARVFEPFFTTKGPGVGSGLGLSICRSIMTDLGGDLSVESVVGRGTRFLARLPMAPPEVSSPVVLAQEAPVAVVRGRILVVDDEPGIRNVLRRMLSGEHEVITAASGREAMTIIQTGAAFDVILCDVMMPELSGMDLHAWLVANAPALARRLIFVSGGAFTPQASAYLARAGNLELEKPFEPSALRSLVARLVATSGGPTCYFPANQ